MKPLSRATQDADLVADLLPAHAVALAAWLEGSYYVDRERIAQAIVSRRSFNAIHLAARARHAAAAGARRGGSRRLSSGSRAAERAWPPGQPWTEGRLHLRRVAAGI